MSASCFIPSLVETKESLDDGAVFTRDLFGRHTGWVSRVGVEASSIVQGETLSGRSAEGFSSH